MKRNKFLNHILLACSVLVLFSACRKVPAGDLSNENPTAGKSYIGFPNGLEQNLYFDPFTTVKAIDVFAMKKDAASPAELQKSQTIVLTPLPAAIDKYNQDNDTEYELLPKSLYTISAAGVTAAADGKLSFNFAPGDFQKYFTIKLDGSKWDLSIKYAVAYKITSAGSLSIHAASKDTLYAFFAIKNKYDGEYHSTGNFDHPNDANDRAIDRDKTLTTAGPTAVSTELADLGGSMTLTINEATNNVTVTGNVSATQPLEAVPGLTNTYDPATKTFHLNYRYLGGGGYRVIQEDIAHK